MKLWAHRGSHGHHNLLENTMAAFEQAISEEADGIELDVHLSADSVPIVFHDETLERLSTNGDSRALATVVSEQLFEVPLQNGCRMPPLSDVLALVSSRIPLNIEIKDARAVGPVAKCLSGYPSDAALISSFDASAIGHAADCLPKNERAWISGDRSLHPMRAFFNWFPAGVLSKCRAHRWHTHSAFVRKGTVMRLASLGLSTHVWTVNDPKEVSRLAEMGVAGIFTDWPARMREALDLESAGRDHR